MDTEKNLSIIVIVIMAVVLGFGAGFGVGWMSAVDKNTGDLSDEFSGDYFDETDNLASASAGSFDSGRAISASNQPAGGFVDVDIVKFENPGWVVIYEERDGKAGNILGAQLFDAGTFTGKVDLLRETIAGGTYYAVLHTDDGDREFDFTKDLPIEDSFGGFITAVFVATAGS